MAYAVFAFTLSERAANAALRVIRGRIAAADEDFPPPAACPSVEERPDLEPGEPAAYSATNSGSAVAGVFAPTAGDKPWLLILAGRPSRCMVYEPPFSDGGYEPAYMQASPAEVLAAALNENPAGVTAITVEEAAKIDRGALGWAFEQALFQPGEQERLPVHVLDFAADLDGESLASYQRHGLLPEWLEKEFAEAAETAALAHRHEALKRALTAFQPWPAAHGFRALVGAKLAGTGLPTDGNASADGVVAPFLEPLREREVRLYAGQPAVEGKFPEELRRQAWRVLGTPMQFIAG